MKKISTLNERAHQSFRFEISEGNTVEFVLAYSDNQKGWFYSVTWGSFAVTNRRLVTSPNILRPFRKIIPFGVACTTTDGYEPVFIDDFKRGRASLYFLTESEVDQVETGIIHA